LRNEASVLKKLSHPNIVQYIGVLYLNPDWYLMTEFMDKGSLESYLKNNTKKDVSAKELVSISSGIAKGMIYLSAEGIVHRDLAARNVLLKQGDRCLEVKIADFGLSRKVQRQTGVYILDRSKRSLPIKWTAPEVFTDGNASSESDRWSFGKL